MIRYCLSLLILILLAIIAQQFLPAFIGLYNARVFVLLVVFLCIAVSVPMPVMFLFALICGFIWDAQCSLSSPEVDTTVYTNPVPSLRFGVSILLFGLVGMLMQGFRPLFLQGKWYLSALLTGIATFLYCLSEYSLLDFFRSSFTIGRGVLLQCSYTALLSMMISPVIFALLFLIARIFNHSIVEQKKTKHYYS